MPELTQSIRPGKVSIVIAAYNAAGHIGRCLESVFSQTCRAHQVVVVDDASTDSTQDVVRAFGDRVEYLRLDRNHGPAYARTVGLGRCGGEFVTILDADDYWHPEFIETTVGFLSAHPEAAAVSTAYRNQCWDGTMITRPVLTAEESVTFPSSGAMISDFFEFWGRHVHILTGTAMLRAAVVRQTGGQREELRLTEDWEFWGYLATFGAWGFIPRHLFVRDERATSAGERMGKIMRRYQLFSAMSTAEWEKRIRSRITAEQTSSLNAVVERVATVIAFSNIYTGSYRRAWKFARMGGVPQEGRLSSVLRLGLQLGPLPWPLICLSIRLIQYVNTYLPGITGLLGKQNIWSKPVPRASR